MTGRAGCGIESQRWRGTDGGEGPTAGRDGRTAQTGDRGADRATSRLLIRRVTDVAAMRRAVRALRPDFEGSHDGITILGMTGKQQGVELSLAAELEATVGRSSVELRPLKSISGGQIIDDRCRKCPGRHRTSNSPFLPPFSPCHCFSHLVLTYSSYLMDSACRSPVVVPRPSWCVGASYIPFDDASYVSH